MPSPPAAAVNELTAPRFREIGRPFNRDLAGLRRFPLAGPLAHCRHRQVLAQLAQGPNLREGGGPFVPTSLARLSRSLGLGPHPRGQGRREPPFRPLGLGNPMSPASTSTPVQWSRGPHAALSSATKAIA